MRLRGRRPVAGGAQRSSDWRRAVMRVAMETYGDQPCKQGKWKLVLETDNTQLQ